jgi:hypothetical protein
MKELCETFLEYDLNPFMVFSSQGKLIHYNQEAEYLLSFVTPHKLYELAISYAPKSFGTRRSQVDIRYDRYIFCVLLVGYLDDEKIGIKLYKEMTSIAKTVDKDDTTLINLFSLLELSKNSIFANKNVLITESLDPTIPEMNLHVESFLKLLNRIFTEYANSNEIEILVRLKIGQNLVVNGKSYPICNVSIQDVETSISDTNALHALAIEANVMLIIKDSKTLLEFPIIA